MDHIGIDLGSHDSRVCIRHESGDIIQEMRCRTGERERLLRNRAAARVVLETCTEAFRIATVAGRYGHEVRIVAATLVRSLGAG